jgi:hypothetical protein
VLHLQASKFQDPVTGADVIMFIQTDASARVRAEELLGHVLDAEHALLEEVFPRQVGTAVTRDTTRVPPGCVCVLLEACTQLAYMLVPGTDDTATDKHAMLGVIFVVGSCTVVPTQVFPLA